MFSSNTNQSSFQFVLNGETKTYATLLALTPLYSAVEKSKYIIDLHDNWDDEGSCGYTKETLFNAISFLFDYAEWVFENFNTVMYIPSIYHGRTGGIDLVWKEENLNLLIRIDKDVKVGVFYAEDKKRNQTTEGKFEMGDINYFMLPIPIEY